MKRKIRSSLLASVLLMLCTTVFGQTEKQIAAIRSEVAAINKSARAYKKAKREIDNLSAEGGTATYFLAGDDLKKISAKFYGETGNSIDEYFYRGGELIFAFRRLEYYDKPIDGGQAPKVSKVEEIRAYFDGGKCIRLLKGKRPIKQGTVAFDEEIYPIRETSDVLVAKLRADTK